MRDLRKFRNKLTLELDNRQIAFLFAGLLAVLAIVFALGIVVGKGLGRMDGERVASNGTPVPVDMPTPKQIVADAIEVKQADLPTGPVEMTPSPNNDTVNILTPAPTPAPTPSGASSFPLPTQTPKPSPVATPPVAPPPSGEAPTPPTGGGWTVQLSSHHAEAEAQARQKQYIAKGIQAYILKANIPGKGIWYRVRVGQFSTKQGAQQYRDALAAKEGIEPIVQPIP